MFCANCGQTVLPGTNFCPACGTRVAQPESFSAADATQAPGPDAQSRWTGVPPPPAGRLVRPRSPRILGGVCAAFALHFGWDLTAVRIATVIFALFYGIGVLVYIACWIILPEAQYSLPQQSR